MSARDKRYRVGRKVGRTIYRQDGAEASDDDQLIGLMDTEWLAERFVAAVNGLAVAAARVADLEAGIHSICDEAANEHLYASDGPSARHWLASSMVDRLRALVGDETTPEATS